MKQFRKYSKELKTILLDEKYLFAYSSFDGFSYRGLKAEFVVDYDYNYILELNASNHQKITNNNSDSLFEKGTLLGKKLKFIEILLSCNYNSLKQTYDFETFVTSDTSGQQILINLDRITKCIHIQDGLPIEYFETPSERNLFKFNEYFKKMIEMKYENWILK